MSDRIRWTLDELGRVGMTHALDPAPLAAALGLGTKVVVSLIATGGRPEPLTDIDPVIATYVLDIMVIVELRCGGDGVAMRAALIRACPKLGGRSIADALLEGPDLAGLAGIRAAIATLEVPKVKMWRTADRYS